jgi:hypothetical protein
MEEARKKEEDALKTELEIKIERTLKEISILVVNMKTIPVTVYKHNTYHFGSQNKQDTNTKVLMPSIEAEVPQTVPFGNAFILTIPTRELMDSIESRALFAEIFDKNNFFECNVFIMTGEIYTVDILLEYRETMFDSDYWHVYASPQKFEKKEQIKLEEYYLGYFCHPSFSKPKQSQEMSVNPN